MLSRGPDYVAAIHESFVRQRVELKRARAMLQARAGPMARDKDDSNARPGDVDLLDASPLPPCGHEALESMLHTRRAARRLKRQLGDGAARDGGRTLAAGAVTARALDPAAPRDASSAQAWAELLCETGERGACRPVAVACAHVVLCAAAAGDRGADRDSLERDARVSMRACCFRAVAPSRPPGREGAFWSLGRATLRAASARSGGLESRLSASVQVCVAHGWLRERGEADRAPRKAWWESDEPERTEPTRFVACLDALVRESATGGAEWVMQLVTATIASGWVAGSEASRGEPAGARPPSPGGAPRPFPAAPPVGASWSVGPGPAVPGPPLPLGWAGVLDVPGTALHALYAGRPMADPTAAEGRIAAASAALRVSAAELAQAAVVDEPSRRAAAAAAGGTHPLDTLEALGAGAGFPGPRPAGGAALARRIPSAQLSAAGLPDGLFAEAEKRRPGPMRPIDTAPLLWTDEAAAGMAEVPGDAAPRVAKRGRPAGVE